MSKEPEKARFYQGSYLATDKIRPRRRQRHHRRREHERISQRTRASELSKRARARARESLALGVNKWMVNGGDKNLGSR